MKALLLPVLVTAVFLSPGCAVFDGIRERREKRAAEARSVAQREQARVAHAAWRAGEGWRGRIYRNDELMRLATKDNISIEIALSEQRGLLLVDGAIAMDFPVATGRKSHPTPPGSYTVRAKEKDYASNLYGKIIDATGTVLVADADARKDAVPEGASFMGSQMPYWMRLTDSGVGMHVGYVPGRPASHGCIRLKRSVAEELFRLTRVGTPVVIEETAPALAGQGES